MTTPSLSGKLRQKIYLKRYLAELSALTGGPVQADELVSLEQTAKLREAQQQFVALPTSSSEIPFSDRGSERFAEFVRRLHDANPSPVYVWTERTIDCGALLVPSLMAIRWNFDFAVNEEGMLAFVTSDIADSLLLDFSALHTGEQRMKVETKGANWEEVAY
jgi:hypothetical protein